MNLAPENKRVIGDYFYKCISAMSSFYQSCPVGAGASKRVENADGFYETFKHALTDAKPKRRYVNATTWDRIKLWLQKWILPQDRQDRVKLDTVPMPAFESKLR